MLCHYWYFKNICYKFKSNVWNKCHDVLITAYELKNIEILNVKDIDCRSILWGIRKNEAVNILNSSVIEFYVKGHYKWNLAQTKHLLK